METVLPLSLRGTGSTRQGADDLRMMVGGGVGWVRSEWMDGGVEFTLLVHYWLDEPSPTSVSILPTLKSAAFLPSCIHKYSFSLCYICSSDTYSVIVIQNPKLHSAILFCPFVFCSLPDRTSRLRLPHFTVPSCTSKTLVEDQASKQAFLLLNGQTSSAYKHLLPTYNSISFLQLELNSP